MEILMTPILNNYQFLTGNYQRYMPFPDSFGFRMVKKKNANFHACFWKYMYMIWLRIVTYPPHYCPYFESVQRIQNFYCMAAIYSKF